MQKCFRPSFCKSEANISTSKQINQHIYSTSFQKMSRIKRRLEFYQNKWRERKKTALSLSQTFAMLK